MIHFADQTVIHDGNTVRPRPPVPRPEVASPAVLSREWLRELATSGIVRLGRFVLHASSAPPTIAVHLDGGSPRLRIPGAWLSDGLDEFELESILLAADGPVVRYHARQRRVIDCREERV